MELEIDYLDNDLSDVAAVLALPLAGCVTQITQQPCTLTPLARASYLLRKAEAHSAITTILHSAELEPTQQPNRSRDHPAYSTAGAR